MVTRSEVSHGSTGQDGDAQTAVVVHSAGLASGVYEPLFRLLEPGLNPVGLDLPGHGVAPAPFPASALKSWDIFYDSLEQYLERLGRPAVIIGHSMGGTVGLVAAARRPELVSALVLIEPGVMPPWWRPGVWLVQKLGLSMRVPFVTRAVNRKSAWPGIAEAAGDIIGKGPFKAWQSRFMDAYLAHGFRTGQSGEARLICDPLWEGRCLAMAPTGIWRFVPRVKAPALVLYGSESTTFLPSVAKRFRACLPDADVRRIDCGHFIPMEKPDECARAISGFLEERGMI